jgi:hypothetical protein
MDINDTSRIPIPLHIDICIPHICIEFIDIVRILTPSMDSHTDRLCLFFLKDSYKTMWKTRQQLHTLIDTFTRNRDKYSSTDKILFYR